MTSSLKKLILVRNSFKGRIHVRNKMGMSFFIALTISTFFLFFFSQVGTYAYDVLLSQGAGYAQGTKVGTVDISGLTSEDAEGKITNAINDWKQEPNMTVEYSEFIQSIDNHIFDFDVKNTMKRVKDGKEIPLTVSVNDALFGEIISNVAIDNLDITGLKNDFISTASMLDISHRSINLISYVQPAVPEKTLIVTSEFSGVSDKPEFNKLVNVLPEITIPSQKKFSISKILEENDIEITNENMNVLSSLLYKLVLQTNFEIVERQISVNKPASIEVGYEALVVPNEIDFSFINPNKNEFQLKFENKNNQLVASLFGQPFYYEYKVKTASMETYQPKTIVQYSPLLTKGNKQIKENGSVGYQVKVVKEIYGPDGVQIDTKQVSTDFYAPVFKEVVVSTLDEINNPTDDENNQDNTDENVGENNDSGEAGTGSEDELDERNEGSKQEQEDEEDEEGDLFDIPGKEIPEK